MDAGDAVELFLQSRVGRGAADSTLRTYRKALGLFARSYPLTREGVLAFVAELRSRQLSPHTVASYIRALKAFLRFLADEGLIAWRLDLRPPRADRTPKAIREEDQRRMIRAAKGRDRAMLLLLYDTGMRASELLSLRWEQIDLAGRRIWLRGKGGRARTVFFTPRTARALAALPRTDPVFPLTYSGLRKVLERLARQAGARKPYLAHAWRHAFAIRMVRAGMPTLALQRLMGHSTPAVTEIYVRLAEEELGEIYDRFAGGRRKR